MSDEGSLPLVTVNDDIDRLAAIRFGGEICGDLAASSSARRRRRVTVPMERVISSCWSSVSAASPAGITIFASGC